jgi:hypothetical protein
VRARLTALALALAAGAAPAGAQPNLVPPPAPATVLLVSDLHFNPFADPSIVPTLAATPAAGWRAVLQGSSVTRPSGFGADANYPLVQSALNAMRSTAPHPAFVVVTGDFFGHDFDDNYAGITGDTTQAGLSAFAARTVEFLALQMAAAYPRVPVFPSIGNNDSDCGDYTTQPGGPYLRAVAQAWAPLANRAGGAPEFASTVAVGGYYAAGLPAGAGRLVVFNSVFWSPKYEDCVTPQSDPGAQALAWLGWTLYGAQTVGERVWAAGHIPPGADMYGTTHSGAPVCAQRVQPMFATRYGTVFDSLMAQYGGTVPLAFTGHTHMDEFRVWSGTGGARVAGKGVPSVSPFFGNAPAFLVAQLAPDGSIANYTSYVLGNLQQASSGAAPARWARSYDFNSAYGQQGLNTQSLLAVAQAAQTDGPARKQYIQSYDSGTGSARITPSNWPAYGCSMGHTSRADFTACFCGAPGASASPR